LTQPVVVKLGTGLVVGKDGEVRIDLLDARASEIAAIVARNEPVCVVSSGAIALGLPKLGLKRRPSSLARLQAASALGQARLHAAWEEALGAHGMPAAQILLAAGDVADRLAYVNARQAFAELFRLGAVPVVNENDATATDEITFGDNDALAAQVAILVKARLLVLLTEVEGLYSRAPGTPGAELIAEGELAGKPNWVRERAGPRWNGQQGDRRSDGVGRRDPDRDRERGRRRRARPRARGREARDSFQARGAGRFGVQDVASVREAGDRPPSCRRRGTSSARRQGSGGRRSRDLRWEQADDHRADRQ
jgi:uridylate kinase